MLVRIRCKERKNREREKCWAFLVNNMPFGGNFGILFYIELQPSDFYSETGHGFLLAARFLPTLFHLSTFKLPEKKW